MITLGNLQLIIDLLIKLGGEIFLYGVLPALVLLGVWYVGSFVRAAGSLIRVAWYAGDGDIWVTSDDDNNGNDTEDEGFLYD